MGLWENIDYDHITFALFITESCDTGESLSLRIATESTLHLVLPKFGKATVVVNHVRSANLQDVIGKADELVISSQSSIVTAYTGAVRG